MADLEDHSQRFGATKNGQATSLSRLEILPRRLDIGTQIRHMMGAGQLQNCVVPVTDDGDNDDDI